MTHARHPCCPPVLDPEFLPAALWAAEYEAQCAANAAAAELVIGLERPDGTVFQHRTRVLPDHPATAAATGKYLERLVKFLLWQKGGATIYFGGPPALARGLAAAYRETGARAFDVETIGRRLFGKPLTVVACAPGDVPPARERALRLGRHLEGCRIGFDLGGSDRKSAAVIDGRVVFSEEVRWDPYFQKDPSYHEQGIRDSLRRAAAHLPRVEAIGGSAAGCYLDNEVRLGSLYRGLSPEDFERRIRGLFLRLKAEWGGVPLEIVNDGEVAALAGSMTLNANALLGISMGTSMAAGYCRADGYITTWLNELAFAPVDFREDAPVDEWSGDRGCGAQYSSQQAVARLAPRAGIELPSDLPLAEQLVEVQRLMEREDPRARRVYETIGGYLGYAIGWYARFYDLRHVLLLGRVTSGAGGAVIVEQAQRVLAAEFPALAERVRVHLPDETFKRHGQAIAAASLPEIPPPPAGTDKPTPTGSGSLG